MKDTVLSKAKDLHQELDRFLQTLHRRRASTNATYGAVLTQFLDSLSEDADLRIAAADFLTSKNLKPGTHNLYLSAISRFLFERGLITREDRDELNRHRAHVQPPSYAEHGLDGADLTRFFVYLRTQNARGNRLRNQQDLVIFALQYACAMRISEVLTLKCDDITETDNALYIRISEDRSKNHVARTVPLRYGFTVANINVSAELKVWLTVSSSLPLGEGRGGVDLVFFNLRAGNLGTPITPDGMIEKYTRIKTRLGITTGRATHALRHTRITELANNRDIPLPVISEFAGHHSKGQPNVSTTLLYIQRPKPDDVAKFL